MKHFGDIAKINGAEVPTVDIITGGSPCQDLSVAGKRAGLAGERSGLFMEQMRIVKEMRERDRANGRTGWMVRPRYMVWENVDGARTSPGGNRKGADFAAVIEEIIKVAEPGASVSVCVPNGGWTKSGCYYAEDGSWSIAWRVHDAQFWGVPQRRKRISLVADFGGLSAPEILFERKGLSRDFEPCGEAGQEAAGAAGEGIEGASCYGLDHVMLSGGTTYQGRGYYDNVSGCLKTQPHGVCETISFQERAGKPGGDKVILIQHEHVGALSTLNNQSVLQTREPILLESNQNHATVQTDGISTALPASMGMVGGYVPMVTAYGIDQQGEEHGHQPIVYNGENITSPLNKTDPQPGDPCHTLGTDSRNYLVYENHSQDSRYKPLGEVSETVSAKYGTGGNNQPLVVSDAVCVGNGQLNQMSMAEQANTPDTMHDQQAVMVAAVDCRHGKENTKVNGTLQAKEQGQNLNSNNVCRVGSVVRRLTPLECERLQGYPDGWTDIGEWVDSKGKKHKDADSPRYKALGNSIALPFWQWLAKRISAQYERTPTMASLFDGIGGFPLVFQRCGAVPVWASEIEEFPIAVTKIRFPEEEQL